jgi:hypothetical protein
MKERLGLALNKWMDEMMASDGMVIVLCSPLPLY